MIIRATTIPRRYENLKLKTSRRIRHFLSSESAFALGLLGSDCTHNPPGCIGVNPCTSCSGAQCPATIVYASTGCYTGDAGTHTIPFVSFNSHATYCER